MSGLLSAEHIGTVAAIVVIVTAILVAARLRRGSWTVTAARILAIVLAGDEIAWWIYLVATHANKADLLYALPFQLCDAAIIISAIALWTRQQLLIEVTYFWGLAGTFQALITPDIPSHFPSFTYIQYYVAHGGVVAAALFLVAPARCCGSSASRSPTRRSSAFSTRSPARTTYICAPSLAATPCST